MFLYNYIREPIISKSILINEQQQQQTQTQTKGKQQNITTDFYEGFGNI